MKKLREADKIRESSLAVGSKKLAEGCDGCADGYFELARRHGATEEDIQKARSISRLGALKAGAAGLAGLAAAATFAPHLASASSRPATTAKDDGWAPSRGDAMRPLVAAALHNPDVRALRSELEQRGYTLDLGHSLGYQNRNSGMRAELFMFVSPSDSNDTAVLTWSSTGSGQEKAFADTRRVNPAASLPDNYSDLTPDQALQWVQANVQTTRLTAQTGAVSPDFSLSGPCFDQCVLRMCGSAALTCLIASIGYLECLGFLCGGYYLICASTC